MFSKDQEEFLKNFKNRSYTDVFITRIKFGGSHVRSRLPLNANLNMFENKNQYGTKRNVLYISIPFCLSHCKYCFYFKSPFNEKIMDAYVDALEKEVILIKDTPYIQTTQFESIYFGGGTPSTLTVKQIDKLVSIIQKYFNTTNDVEITFESNPFSLTKEKISILKDNGVNRISLGVQSFNDNILKKMNCKHNRKEAIESINKVLSYDFKLNIDMIFGFPDQDENQLNADFDIFNNFDKPHQITYFPLRINPDTLLFNQDKYFDKKSKNDNYKKLLAYDAYINRTLADRDYIREEIPIFYYKKGSTPHRYGSLEGRIIGLGAGGGTLFDQSESVNIFDVNEYIECLRIDKYPVLADSVLTMQQSCERFIFFRILFMDRNLKNFESIVEREYEDYFEIKIGKIYDKVIHDMKKRDLIFIDRNVIKFTPKFESILENFTIGMPSIN